MPAGIARGLLNFVMYSLLFAPMWIVLAFVAVTFTASAARRDPKGAALIALSVFFCWGLIGEVRMLLDPALIGRLQWFGLG